MKKEEIIKKLCQELKARLQYHTASCYCLEKMPEITVLTFSSQNKQNVYLKLFIGSEGDNCNVNVIGQMADAWCVTKLNEEEKARMFNFGKMYEYHGYNLSMLDMTGADTDAFVSYVTTDDLNSIVCTRSVVASRILLSDIIQDYFWLQDELPAIKEKDPEAYEHLVKRDVKSEVIEVLADYLRDFGKCKESKVVYKRDDEDIVNAIVYILGYKNEMYQLYIQADKKHCAVYCFNGKERVLMPERIPDIARYITKKPAVA